jgi:caffeoyl-CoA O-methyltransferase
VSRSFALDPAVHAYVVAHSTPLDPVQQQLVARTAELGDVAGMQTGPDQVVLLTLLARAIGARRAIEVGTFTGASALALAKGLADGGTLLCCDVSEEWTAIAQEAWAAAGVADRIELRIGPAAETLATLPEADDVDLAYIDADKGGYLDYFEAIVPRLRPGGLLLADNTLWGGRVADAEADDANTIALRAFNDHVVADPRVDAVVVSIGDGLTVCVRNAG